MFPLKVKVKKASEWNVNIVSPIGERLHGFVKTLPNGQLGVRFTPRDVGNHIINLIHPSEIIKNPLITVITENDLLDATKVKVIGNNLERCQANTESFCTIDTKEAGNDSLSILIEGGGKCEMHCDSKDDGSYILKYKFNYPGEYKMSLKFGDDEIPGSPFVMRVQPKEDSSEFPEFGTTDSPPHKKMRLETEHDQKKEELSTSRIIKLERENAFLRMENGNLARLLKLSENRTNPDICKNESKRTESTVAIHYLNEILQKHSSYYGQSINEAKIAETIFVITGDNKVLECCLGLSMKFKNVYLLTKDVNLLNVAELWKVRTYDIKRLEVFLKPGKNFGFKELREERKKLFGQTSQEADESDDDSSSNPIDTSLTTSEDYSSE